MGTFEILRRQPKTFAAAFAICGGDYIENAKKHKNVPLWIFHGGFNDVVNPQLSYSVFRELRRLGNEPKYTIYPKANHNSCGSAFAEPELVTWPFSNSNNKSFASSHNKALVLIPALAAHCICVANSIKNPFPPFKVRQIPV